MQENFGFSTNFKDLKLNYHFTSSCDMACKFCFARINSTINEEKVLETFRKNLKLHNYINLVGGEVFLYPDLLRKMIEEAKNANVKISIVTNGFLLANEIHNKTINFILENICLLGISVDSLSDSTNISMRRCTKAKETLTANDIKTIIKKCNEINLPVKINTVVHKINKDENLSEFFRELKIAKWKRFHVVSDENDIKISDPEFENYLFNNRLSKVECRNESASLMNTSYLICNQYGDYYIEQNQTKVNVDNLLKISNEERLNKVSSMGFDIDGYFFRYQSTNVNLHIHSSFSDGVNSPKEIIKQAEKEDLKYYSITDHNNIEFYKSYNDIPKNLIIGCELDFVVGEDEYHLLQYDFDVNLMDKILKFDITKRREHYTKLFKSLKKEFPSLELPKKKYYSKSMFVNLLINEGITYDIEVSEYIIKKHMRPFGKYHSHTTKQMIKNTILKTKSISVLAHPFNLTRNGKRVKISFNEVESKIKYLKESGLIHGIEAFYKSYTREEINYLLDLADKHNLLISFGSDYHGKRENDDTLNYLNCHNEFSLINYIEKRKNIKKICIDGLSGSGKTTQLELLKTELSKRYKVLEVGLPTNNYYGNILKKLYTDDLRFREICYINPRLNQQLITHDYNLNELFAITYGYNYLLYTRGIVSTTVMYEKYYESLADFDDERRLIITDLVCMSNPDMTIFLDCHPKMTRSRIVERARDKAREIDDLSNLISYREELLEIYNDLNHYELDFKVAVLANNSIEEIHKLILSKVKII